MALDNLRPRTSTGGQSASIERPPPAGGLLWLAPLLGIGAVISFGFATRPILAAAALLLLCGGSYILLFHRALPDLFVGGLGIVLLGYALFGRSFAYLGVPPVFVGEMMLGLGILATLASGSMLTIARSPAIWLIVAFSLWGVGGTVPYVGTYGIDSLRDAALWGYSVFAVLVAACVLSTRSMPLVLRYYSRWVLPFAIWLPVALLLARTFGEGQISMPGTSEPMFAVKPNDAGVHLAGAAVFVLAGLDAGLTGGTGAPRSRRLFWALWGVALLFVAALTRGGFLGVVAALLVATVLDPMGIGKRVAAFGGAAFAFAIVLLLVSSNLEETGRLAPVDQARELSPRQVVENVLSISGKDAGTLSDTRTWRLDWWNKIIDYTLFGPFFWTGKGFGVNLADDDGFQVAAGEVKTLRSPHSGHMTVLARMGVPGAALWIALNLCFAGLILLAYRRAIRSGAWIWARIDMWILSYWAAFLVSASFDVVLEGPYGGIWFWCLIGLGVAALEMQRTRVPALDDARMPT